MNQDPTKRKLTAILSADVVGYSRLMEADEAWTIQSLEENKKIISSLIEELNGRVVDSPGDNLLAEFSSVINAVECAVKIQNKLNYKNSNLLEERRMHFRIGVNLGDVVEEDGRLYGNGVNIAARLESLSEPGGICISHTAYDQVKNKVNVEYEYLGEYQVKNINEPIRAYRILMEGESAEKYSTLGKSREKVISFKKAIAVFTIILVLAVGATISILNPKPSKPLQVTRFSVDLPEGYEPISNPTHAISPDGSQFAVTTSKGIYLRSMDELIMKLVAGTMGNTRQPFFSPDGESIAYWSVDDNQLKKVSVAGGKPIPLYKDEPSIAYYHWGTDGNIYFASNNGIMRVSENGGIPEAVIAAKNNEMFFSPQLLPDEKSVMFTLNTDEGYKIVIQSLHTKKRTILFKGETALYLPTEHVIYINDNVLYAVPFDIDKLEPTGEHVPVVENIFKNGPPHFCVSNSGTFVYLRNPKRKHSLVWVDFNGKEEELSVVPDYYQGPMISPNGNRIALNTEEDSRNYNIGILDIARGNIIHPSHYLNIVVNPIWSPDSQRIVFSGNYEDAFTMGVYQMLSSGTRKAEHLYTEPGRQIMPKSFSKDGKVILCEIGKGTNNRDIGMLTIDEDPQWNIILEDEYNKRQTKFSPDDRWIAYTSNRSGRYEVYIRSFPEVDEIWEPISTDGGNSPLWSPDSQKIYYRNSDSVIAATYETERGFKVVDYQVLFKDTYYNRAPVDFSWDIHPDGAKFLMMKETAIDTKAEESQRRIDIIQNWFEELKKRVPVD